MAYQSKITAAADWRSDRRARCILQSIAAVTPATRILASHERWDRAEEVYTGYRVEALGAIREQVVGAQLREVEAKNTADRALLNAVIDQIGVQDAVAEAVRIQPVHVITTAVRRLDSAIWGTVA